MAEKKYTENLWEWKKIGNFAALKSVDCAGEDYQLTEKERFGYSWGRFYFCVYMCLVVFHIQLFYPRKT